MAKSGDVLDIPECGTTIEFHRTAADTAGELCEFEVRGRGRGILAQEHIHLRQTERFEPVAGTMLLGTAGRDEIIGPGDVREVPPGTPHRQAAAGDAPAIVRVTLRPAGRTEAFLERLAEFSHDGRMLKSGFPRPTAAAEMIRDFADEGRASKPPAAVQSALATAILGGAQAGRALRERAGTASGEYLFVDEWDVAAAPEAVFDALADARTYPRWWTPVYIEAEADGPPELGRESRQHFKGRLPYHLHTRSTITRLERPHVLEGDVTGDLCGRGLWTLTPIADGTHVRFDWRVFADRPLLRTLTPVLRPLFRWNHDYAISRAKAGLEPYARGTSPARLPAPEPEPEPAGGGDDTLPSPV
jgi:uncharacterized protein YndB with AHSA1/START domain/mannose-6-phosphate isomerase-like protein (cupin superfamily)